jgi:hypothetical protein
MSDPSAALSSGLQRQTAQGVVETIGMPGVRANHIRKTLGENRSQAIGGTAIEFPSVKKNL